MGDRVRTTATKRPALVGLESLLRSMAHSLICGVFKALPLFRRTPISRRHGLLLLAGVMILYSACVKSENPTGLCDLRELDPSLKTLGKMERSSDGRLRLVNSPDAPSLVPCACEVDPWLKVIASRNPMVDAQSSADEGILFLYARPVLGTLVPVAVDMTLEDNRQQLELRRIPGVDEHASCFEREELTMAAFGYAKQYNETILRLAGVGSGR
jgi:hypothetical protein